MEFLPTYRFNTDRIPIDVAYLDIPKRMSRDEKIKWFAKIIVEKQLELFGLTWEEMKIIQRADPDWEKHYTLTKEQYDDLQKFAMSLLYRLFKWNKKLRQKEWSWFTLNNTFSIKYKENKF